MKWRSASENPRMSGVYLTIHQDSTGRYLSNDYYLTTSKWDTVLAKSATLIAWLDPEVPDKFLRPIKGVKADMVYYDDITGRLAKVVKNEAKEQVDKYLQGATASATITPEELADSYEKGEWVNVKEFIFNPDCYFWAREDYRQFIVDGYWCGRGAHSLASETMIWSIPIEEPPV